ncbi:MAG TPA: imidazolonepropionase [Gemmatimonadales bacterium]|nr:imidazolonepropionase [Gemmatimonadales bacterium]
MADAGNASAADLLITGMAQLATAPAPGPRAGSDQAQIVVIPDAAMALADGRIVWTGPRDEWRGSTRLEVSAGNRAVIPALVDPHTHAIWAGDRLADFEARARGEKYEEILARGGGIRSTVEATSGAAASLLVDSAAARVNALVASGAATIEVKSGYGFTPEAEIRSLEAIAALRTRTSAHIHATLLVHVPPNEGSQRSEYVRTMAEEVVPEVARRQLATAVDVFVEREAFSVAEAELILRAALASGLEVTLHADQFHAIGGSELAAQLGGRSVDHLEASGSAQVAALAAVAPRTVATVLPGVSLHLGLPAAPARALVDAGVPVAIATDLNPGSSPMPSTMLAMALAVRLNGLSPAEALVAGTANAAAALRDPEGGVLLPGARADFVILDADDWREATYRLGPAAAETWIGGRRA